MKEQFPSTFELWEFVSSFEDGSFPAAAWNEQALAAIAVWYLFLLPPTEAVQRLETGLQRNHVRFANRTGALGGGLITMAEVWPHVLRHVLGAFGEDDPVAIANRLLQPRISEVRDRAA